MGKNKILNLLSPGLGLEKYIKRAVFAECALFMSFGFVYITFFSRFVNIRELLGHLSPSKASILLLSCSAGSLLSAPLVGFFIKKDSIRKFIRIFATSAAFFLVFLSQSVASLHNFHITMVMCFLLGTCLSIWNISINISGVIIEERAGGKSLLPRFHAFFQIGGVLATSFSILMSYLEFDIRIQFLLVAFFAICIIQWQVFYLFKQEASMCEVNVAIDTNNSLFLPNKKGLLRSLLQKLKNKGLDRIVIFIGLIVLASTLAEGSGTDWIASAIVESFHTKESVGLIGLWIYLGTTSITRYFGIYLVDRFGDYKMMKACFCCVFIGVLIFVFANTFILAFVGCLLWGFGVSLAYPIGISAANKSDAKTGEFRTSIVSSIGGIMNIAAPPTIGVLAKIYDIRMALLILIPTTIMGIMVSSVLKKVKSNS